MTIREPGHGAEPPAGHGGISSRREPYIETRIADFGLERAICASNFPVDKDSCSYAALWNAKWRAEPRPTGRSFAGFSPKSPPATLTA
jgi:hypothetical protein